MTHRARATDLLQRRGLVRLTELTSHGVPPSTVTRMDAHGSVVRVTRGLYELAAAITLANPGLVWFAIGAKDRMPKVSHVVTRVVRFGAAASTLGVEHVVIDGVQCRIAPPPRTIVDCFRYRRIVGLDVALEALRLGMRSGKARLADIATTAMKMRIWTVLRPYLLPRSG